jgi:hypothetical protein
MDTYQNFPAVRIFCAMQVFYLACVNSKMDLGKSPSFSKSVL